MKTTTPPNSRGFYLGRDHHLRGFSLVELLVVLMFILALMAVIFPALNGNLRSSRLNAAGRAVTDQLKLAGQTARSRSLPVEIRFYQLPDYGKAATDAATVYRGLQLFTIDENGRALPLDKPEYFHNPVFISTEAKFSGLFADRGDAGSAQTERTPKSSGSDADQSLGEYEWNYKYIAFQFSPSGSTNLKPGKDFVSLVLANGPTLDKGGNFYTIQIDPVSGSVRSFRP